VTCAPLAAAVALALAGCSDGGSDDGPPGVFGITVGTTKAEVRDRIGQPRRIVSADCWEYRESRAWDANHRWFCFDGTNRVQYISRIIHG
jgi:hypothetical protein